MQGSSVFAWVAMALCVCALHLERRADERVRADALQVSVDHGPELTTQELLEEDDALRVGEIAERELVQESRRNSTIRKPPRVHRQVLQDQAWRVSDISSRVAQRIE